MAAAAAAAPAQARAAAATANTCITPSERPISVSVRKQHSSQLHKLRDHDLQRTVATLRDVPAYSRIPKHNNDLTEICTATPLLLLVTCVADQLTWDFAVKRTAAAAIAAAAHTARPPRRWQLCVTTYSFIVPWHRCCSCTAIPAFNPNCSDPDQKLFRL
jgi:hypothetical protein